MTRQELVNQIKTKRSFLCVGLDPDIKKIPQCVIDDCKAEVGDDEEYDDTLAIMAFNQAIIDATAPYCVAYKPNLAFYESLGSMGVAAYEETVAYLRENYPNHFIIADAKRGDIGNTSKMYARSFFEGDTQVDALTVAPYMGEDSVKPFLEYEGKWVILLALTSNKGSEDFQLTPLHTPLVGRWGPGNFKGERLYEKVLKTSMQWGTEENMMYVVGATQGRMFEDIRDIVPHHFLLVPGVGAQGGSLEEVCKYGMNEDCGLLVNSSRGIIFASSGEDFAEVAGMKAKELQEQMARELEAFGI
ncbi:MAG: orotidine-5'-phosphate decarboxylase [Prevotella sp.]|nr:orotidine-5'-phosphate decarboxylase [Prevotella sp.]